MKFYLGLLLSSLLVGCASTTVQKKTDPFSGGEVTSLTNNQLDTPGFGDIYFDLEAVQNGKALTVKVTGKADYEAQGYNALLKIDKTKEFVALVDGERISLKPVVDSYSHTTKVGVSLPLHVESMNYEISMSTLKKISSAKSVSMKMFLVNHKDGGLTGSFTPKNFAKLNEFISSAEQVPGATVAVQK